MKPPPFEYHRPSSVEEVCTLLATLENAKVLAGGQSLMAMLNLRYLQPDHLIDINRIPGIAGIEITGETLSIGAMTRQRAIETDARIVQAAPIFAEALAVVGHRQTRNRGTIGGSLCHLDPAAELPLITLLHDATVRAAATGNRTREIPVDEFITGFMQPGIEWGELVVGIDFPLWPTDHGHAFVERSRRHGDFALASAACLLTVDETGAVMRAAVGVGGVCSVPVRLYDAEADLLDRVVDADTIARAAARCADLDAVSDFHGKADFRRSVATALVRTAITTAYRRAADGRHLQ